MKIKEITEYIYDNKIYYPYKNFKRGIINLIEWFPLVWKDRSCDHAYITDVLKFKIKRTADHISEHKLYIGYENDVKYMRIAVSLIDRLWGNEFYYEGEYIDYMDHKGTNIFDYDESRLVDFINKNKLSYKKVIRKMDKYERENTHNVAIHISIMKHKKAKRLLFKILEENIEKWWD